MPLQKNIAVWVGVMMMSCAVFGQSVEKVSGFYHRDVGCAGCGDWLKLKTDSTFQLNYGFDFLSKKDEGKWTIKHKTVYLHSSKTGEVYKFKIKKTHIKDNYKLKDMQLSIFKQLFADIRKKKYFRKKK